MGVSALWRLPADIGATVQREDCAETDSVLVAPGEDRDKDRALHLRLATRAAIAQSCGNTLAQVQADRLSQPRLKPKERVRSPRTEVGACERGGGVSEAGIAQVSRE